ncbi:DUF3037 domain-containing protein [Chitinophaga agri]|uniref:DUF3037 domain-containing protein n=1 Tax=Chitinophaga agri TaxID=2703787 RepID=A0A6B9ZCR8_9BACT|nr:DUF3037 domain-containing protein [Chitinophaga agri]QHS60160.1 DUF3037 domain-containing protein [Chitinophaga agri]
MQEKHLFEYAVIRVMPRVEREEFLNAGVILYCKQQRFLQALVTLNEERLRAFSPAIDIEEVRSYLNAFECICKGGKQAGPIGELDAASRFRWLTATRSTVVQAGKVHPGFCDDPLKALTRLHEQLVL